MKMRLKSFSKRKAALAAAAGFTTVASLSLPAMAQTGQVCDGAVNFEEADIRAVITEFSSRTGRKYVIDPRVTGAVTIKSSPDSSLCPDEAWELFQAALRAAGYAATPINGDSYKIIPIQDAARAAGPVGGGERGNYVTQIMRLKYIDAREAAATLAQIVSERGVVSPVRTGNALILVDELANVQRLMKVIEGIDKDTTIYKTIPLKNMSAVEASRIVSNVAKEISGENGGQRTPMQVLPVEASNSILVRAEPKIVSRIERIITELDSDGAVKAGLSVVTLDHANAEEMVELLREIAGSQPDPNAQGAGGGTVPLGPRTNISVDVGTNSIIITGDAGIQQMLKDVIAQLDRRRAQVLVEAVIVEVNERTARELGIQYFLSGDGSRNGRVPFTSTNFQRAQPDILASAGAFLLNDSPLFNPGAGDGEGSASNPLADTAISSLLSTNGLILGGAGALSDGSVFGAVLTALQEDRETRILSLPSVVTLDNEPAKLSSGQEIPVTTGESIGDNFSGGAFRSVQRQEVGVILEVTPRITDGDTVTLEISQESSTVAGQIIASSTDLITNKNIIETKALVDNGDVLVLGGLVAQEETYSDSKVPVLGDIPVFGELFKAQGKSTERRNLMIFIRPTILRDRGTAKSATAKKLDYIRARELLDTSRPQSELDRLIEQATGLAGQ